MEDRVFPRGKKQKAAVVQWSNEVRQQDSPLPQPGTGTGSEDYECHNLALINNTMR